MAKLRYVAWMASPGEPGLGCSVAIGAPEEVERVAREIAETPRWRLHNPRTRVTITADPIRQRVVKTFELPEAPGGAL